MVMSSSLWRAMLQGKASGKSQKWTSVTSCMTPTMRKGYLSGSCAFFIRSDKASPASVISALTSRRGRLGNGLLSGPPDKAGVRLA
jgi:hypothetical protein